MAVYAGKTKLPQGSIFDMLEGGRYFGPSRLAAPTIGGGSALGLAALWNKITGGEKEDKLVKKTDDISQSTSAMPPEDEDPENEDDKVEKISSRIREDLVRSVVRQIMEEDLDEGKLQLPKDVEELLKSGVVTSEEDPIRIFLNNYGPDNLKKIISMSSEFEKMYSPKEAADAIRTAFPDIEQFFGDAKQISKGLDLIKKHQGGLVGVNELTRGLQWQ